MHLHIHSSAAFLSSLLVLSYFFLPISDACTNTRSGDQETYNTRSGASDREADGRRRRERRPPDHLHVDQEGHARRRRGRRGQVQGALGRGAHGGLRLRRRVAFRRRRLRRRLLLRPELRVLVLRHPGRLRSGERTAPPAALPAAATLRGSQAGEGDAAGGGDDVPGAACRRCRRRSTLAAGAVAAVVEGAGDRRPRGGVHQPVLRAAEVAGGGGAAAGAGVQEQGVVAAVVPVAAIGDSLITCVQVLCIKYVRWCVFDDEREFVN